MLKALLSLVGALVAAELALVGVVDVTAAVRRRSQQPSPKGFHSFG